MGKQLVEESVQFPTCETCCFPRCHLHLRFPSSGAGMQVQLVEVVRVRALQRASAHGIGQLQVRQVVRRVLHRRRRPLRVRIARHEHRRRAGHFELKTSRRCARKHAARPPAFHVQSAPRLTTRARRSEPRRERPRTGAGPPSRAAAGVVHVSVPFRDALEPLIQGGTQRRPSHRAARDVTPGAF